MKGILYCQGEFAVDLNFTKLIVTIKLEKDVADSYPLFNLRAEFEDAFRLEVNCHSSRCDGCSRLGECPYWQTFSQTISPDPSAVRRHQKPPYPFVFDFPLLPPVPNRGKTLEIGVTLVGSATNYYEYYLAALRRLFRLNTPHKPVFAALLKVESSLYRGDRVLLMAENGDIYPDRLSVLSSAELLKTCDLPQDKVAISIVTPMRIMQDGRPLRDLSFSSFIRALLRRISSLAYYYGGVELELDYKWLARRSTLVECGEADFHWVDWNGRPGSCRMCGIVGRGMFNGDMVDFYPALLLGEYFHLGKGASFGLGQYRIERQPMPCKSATKG